jgi:hypothetical protein
MNNIVIRYDYLKWNFSSYEFEKRHPTSSRKGGLRRGKRVTSKEKKRWIVMREGEKRNEWREKKTFYHGLETEHTPTILLLAG